MTARSTSPSFKDLLKSLSIDIQTLASHTVTLARLEMATAASNLAWSTAGLLISLLAVLAGTALLITALVLLLIVLGLPAWAAATLVGVVLTGGGILGARMCVGAMRRTGVNLEKTRDSLRKTLAWLKRTEGYS